MMIEEKIIKAQRKFNSEYEFITKEYKEIKLKPCSIYHKKIKYNNPDDLDKVLKISSPDSIIRIKNEELKLEYKSSQYIKFAIETPSTEGLYNASVNIYDISKGEIEEILKFWILISN